MGTSTASTGRRFISEIVPSKKDPNFRYIRIGTKTVATLRASDVESLKLECDRPWTNELAKRVERAAMMCKARSLAMRLIGNRDFSSHDLTERLMKRGFDESVAKPVVDELKEDHWIDDERYGSALALELCSRQPLSARVIATRLEAKGIEPELAIRIAQATIEENDPVERALKFARKRFATMKALPTATARRRLASWLARRGFNEDDVCDVLRQLGLDETTTAD